jgi:WD40 repeat protein
MTKVFISYSRKDKVFAAKLKAALDAMGLEAWIDWIDIPPTADWWEQIQKGIETSDAFLFLCSPDSVISKVCIQEVDHAIQNGKRLIPLVIHDINADDAHPALSRLNWIFFRDQDDFDVSLRALETAIKTDLAWVEFHRRLQVRGVEWEKRRDRSLLLRGKDLREAEEQLTVAGQKDPQPTDLQRQYVLESRKTESKTRNRLISASGIAITLLIVLLVFAVNQLNAARSLVLSAQAQAAFAEQNYNMAAVYAYQAEQIDENESAQLILGKLPYENFQTGKALLGHTHRVTDVAWSQDNRLASASLDETIMIWDTLKGQPAQILESNDTDALAGVFAVAWFYDGRLASASADNTIVIWDLKSAQREQILEGHTNTIARIAWSQDGRLASIAADNTIIIWDLDTGQAKQVIQSNVISFFTVLPVASLAWSKDGRLASTSADNTIIIWDLNTGKPKQILSGHTGAIEDLDWSPDGKLASASWDRTVIIWDLETGKPKQILKGHSDAVLGVAWSHDGRLASASNNGEIIIWNVRTGEPAHVLPGHTDAVNRLDWSQDGKLASASDDGTVILWDLEIETEALSLQGHTNYVADLAWSQDGRLASASWDNSIIIWDLETAQPEKILGRNLDASFISVAWSKDGRLASGTGDEGDNGIIIWNLETDLPEQILEGHTDSVTGVAWSQDGKFASSSYDGTVIIWDLVTGKPAQVLTESDAQIWDVAWSQDGRLASGSQNSVTLWDLKTGKPEKILKETGMATGVAWSQDGRLAAAYSNNKVILWDLETGSPALVLEGEAWIGSSQVKWSQDGKLASTSIDKVIIWNLKTGKPEQILRGHDDQVLSIAWGPDGRLASASTDQTVKVTQAKLIRTLPCEWLLRNMTLEEWLTTQGFFFVYKPICTNLPAPHLNLGKWLSENLKYVGHPLLSPALTPLITWQGRMIVLVFASVLVGLLYFLLRILRNFRAKVRV